MPRPTAHALVVEWPSTATEVRVFALDATRHAAARLLRSEGALVTEAEAEYIRCPASTALVLFDGPGPSAVLLLDDVERAGLWADHLVDVGYRIALIMLDEPIGVPLPQSDPGALLDAPDAADPFDTDAALRGRLSLVLEALADPERLCPRCRLFRLAAAPAANAWGRDGTLICRHCGLREGKVSN